MIVADGVRLAKEIKACVKKSISYLSEVPALAVILVGNNPASKIYVRNKAILFIRSCATIIKEMLDMIL